jgi:23S rRNA (uracil1939-C5)-methyltransferase
LPEISIHTLGGLGDGISQLDGKPVFVEKAAAGDVLRVRLIQKTKEFSRGEIETIIKPGADRVQPPCPHYAACGGCNLQHLSESAYRQHKHKVMADALAHAGFAGKPFTAHFLPASSRRRVELKWDGKRFAYYASRSRDLVAINGCLILEPALQALLTLLAEALAASSLASNIKTVSLTAADSGIDVAITSNHPHPLASSLPSPFKGEGQGEGLFLESLAHSLDISRITLDGQLIIETKPITMQLGSHAIALPAGAFLQASKEGQRLLTEAVLAACKGESSVADLFCGIGTYSIPLSEKVRVHSVELGAAMIAGLRSEAKKHGLNLSAEQRDLFTAPLKKEELERFSAVVINPPRPGAKAQCEALAGSNVKKIVMVSCSPASFARDAKILKNAGFSLLSAKAIDQFVYSPHLEIVAVFGR